MKSAQARRFHAKAMLEPGSQQGWQYCRVTVLDGDKELGSYKRNYPRFGEETFEPFEQNGSWYALYSRDYTSTRIMKLPECQDMGGEEPASHGFCPVELFVPRYRRVVTTQISMGRVTERLSFEASGDERSDRVPLPGYESVYGLWLSLDLGFVAGCVWGDDSTWKLEVFDLSRAAEGIITRSARYGHVQLGTMPLAEAVRLDGNPPHWDLRASIIRQEGRSDRHVD